MKLNVGDRAPEFCLPCDDGSKISLSTLRGKKIILYFYPKDNTPGCTAEACNFKDANTSFAKKNTIILGVSRDNPERHKKFKNKYQLPFALLADVDGDVCAAYGVINKKSLFGNTFLGIERSTFLIDEKGYIQAIWRKVKVKDHIQKVLDEIS